MSVAQLPAPQSLDLDDVAALLKESFADGRLDAGEVLKIAMKVAEKANRLAGLSGAEKKVLVLAAVEQAVRAAVPAAQAEQAVSTALQVLPAVLDIAVAAARGRLALETAVKQKVSLGCLVDCFAGLFGSRKAPLSAKEPVASLHAAPVAPAPAPAPKEAPAAPQPATPESATPPPTAQPEPAPQQETPEEPTPEASPEVPPVESRPAEEPEIVLPNTATDLPAQ
jgi:hypothetical protein